MKEKLSIQNINTFFLLAIVATIPFFTKLLSYPIIFWIISSILLIIKSYKSQPKPIINKGIIFLFLYYFSVIASIIYSENKADAFFDAEVKLSLLIIPLLMIFLHRIYQSKRKLVLGTFAISNVIAAIICIIAAINNSLSFKGGEIIFNTIVPGIYEDTNTAPPSYFAYTDFSLFKHPAYFSAYLILSFFIFLEFIKQQNYVLRNKKLNSIIYITSMFIILISIYFLQSKAGYFTFFVVLTIYSLVWLVKRKKIALGFTILALVIVAAMYWYNNNSRFYYIRNAISQREEFIDAAINKEHKFIIERYGIDRISLWMIATEVANKNFVFGCGAGDVHSELNSKFIEYNLESFYKSGYNAHNQFIETFLAQGIIGFVLMLIWLFYPFFVKSNYINGNYLFLLFIIVIAINYMFESMLNSISGVIFTAFFYVFFTTTNTKNVNKKD